MINVKWKHMSKAVGFKIMILGRQHGGDLPSKANPGKKPGYRLSEN
jgi:hypothetical protein